MVLVGLVSRVAVAGNDVERLEQARAAYDRGAAAYDRRAYHDAAVEFGRADELAPNTTVLEMALTAAVRTDDAPLSMALVERAEKRADDFSASLKTASEEAKKKFAGRAGQVIVRCPAEEVCEARIDEQLVATGAAHWVTVGEHEVVIDVRGRPERRFVYVGAGALVEANAEATMLPLATMPVPAVGQPRPLARTAVPIGGGAPRATGLSPAWFWLGAGATALLGAVTVGSAIDTANQHASFTRAPTAQGKDEGLEAQLRTNVLAGATVVVGVTTTVLALTVIDWGGVRSRVHAGPRGAALAGEF